MNEAELRRMLSPRDHSILDATSATKWVPPEPADVLRPYIREEDKTKDRTTLAFRQDKAKEVFDGYGKIIEECKQLEDEISDRCKNVKITLNPDNQLRIIEAVKRVFGGDGREITFQMYQTCVSEMAKIANSNIPNPEDL
jgi:hypothetical protein